MPKTIAVIPAFNEEKNLLDILNRVGPRVDMLVCVNDGSKDGTLGILLKFARGRKGTYIVDLPGNTGMAGALKNGFLFVLYLLRSKAIRPDDIVVTIDADGQHKPEYIPAIVRYFIARKVDIVLTRRNFSVYPLYKRWGNRFLTWTNSLLSGRRYRDVESGFRLLKVKTLEPILRYYTGMKYSCAQEIALVSARSGFKIDNDFLVDIAYYRPGTTLWDGFIVLFFSLLAYFKLLLGVSRRIEVDTPLARESHSSSIKLWKGEGEMKRPRKN